MVEVCNRFKPALLLKLRCGSHYGGRYFMRRENVEGKMGGQKKKRRAVLEKLWEAGGAFPYSYVARLPSHSRASFLR